MAQYRSVLKWHDLMNSLHNALSAVIMWMLNESDS